MLLLADVLSVEEAEVLDVSLLTALVDEVLVDDETSVEEVFVDDTAEVFVVEILLVFSVVDATVPLSTFVVVTLLVVVVDFFVVVVLFFVVEVLFLVVVTLRVVVSVVVSDVSLSLVDSNTHVVMGVSVVG